MPKITYQFKYSSHENLDVNEEIKESAEVSKPIINQSLENISRQNADNQSPQVKVDKKSILSWRNALKLAYLPLFLYSSKSVSDLSLGKVTIYDSLPTHEVTFRQPYLNDKLAQNLKKPELKLIQSDLDKFSILSGAKISFPKSQTDQEDNINYEQYSEAFQEITNRTRRALISFSIFNSLLPESESIKEIMFFKKMSMNVGEPYGLYKNGTISVTLNPEETNGKRNMSEKIVLEGIAFYVAHESNHHFSTGLEIKSLNIPFIDEQVNFNEMLDFITDGEASKLVTFVNGKPKIKSESDLKILEKYGLTSYSLFSPYEIFANFSAILVRKDYNKLSDLEKNQYNKCLAFLTIKNRTYGTIEFKRILSELYSLNNLPEQSIKLQKEKIEKITTTIQELKAKSIVEKIPMDPEIQKYVEIIEKRSSSKTSREYLTILFKIAWIFLMATPFLYSDNSKNKSKEQSSS
jgi:hypothetical protein